MNDFDVEAFLESGALVATSEGKCLVGWGERTWTTEQPHSPSFYFPDYFLEREKSWFTHDFCAEFTLVELLHRLSVTEVKVDSLEWSNHYQEMFFETFQDLQTLFDSGVLKKAVPFVFEEAEGKVDKARLLNCLQSAIKRGMTTPVFVYGFWDQEEGILGATPELLFRMDDEMVETVACAGTCPVHEAHLIKEDPKQMYEHNLVIEGISDSMQPYGEVHKGNTEVLTLPKLCHLVTAIQVKLKKKGEVDSLVCELHPTPALGASPRKEGMVWLKKYQTKIDRVRFGAPVGYVNGKEAVCYVGIRNMQWKNNHIRIGAGCGIVATSQVEKEWAEIGLKIQSIKDILSL